MFGIGFVLYANLLMPRALRRQKGMVGARHYVVEAMVEAGITVDVWNSVTIASPSDPEAEVERLRGRYGAALGTIDLRR